MAPKQQSIKGKPGKEHFIHLHHFCSAGAALKSSMKRMLNSGGGDTYRSISDKGLVSRRLLRVPWTARSNQPILKEINPEYSLEGLMLKLKLQYFGHLMRRDNSLGKDPDAGKD